METNGEGNSTFVNTAESANAERAEIASRLASAEEQETTQANIELARRFNEGDAGGSPSEAVDIPQLYRNES